MTFTPVDLPTYPPDIEQQIVDDYAARRPDWEPSDANPEVVLAQVLSFALAQVNRGLAQREVAELELIGRRRGRPRRQALQATGLARITLAPGAVAPEGLQLLVDVPGGEQVAVQTVEDAGGEVGQTVAEDVLVSAVIPGPAADGAFGPAELYDQFGDVVAAEVTTELQGGQDEEDLDAYLDELVEYLQLFFDDPTLVNARQLAIFVRSHPQVERVLVLDLHVPEGGRLPFGDGVATEAMDGVAGAVAAYPVTAAGEPPASFVRDEVATMVEERREADMILGVGVPTYTDVDVAFTITTVAGVGRDAVRAAAEQAVRDHLDPARWGIPTTGDPSSPDTPGLWRVDRLVRFGELYAVLNAVVGVEHVLALTIDGQANVDVTLAGPAPLPRAADVVGSLA